MRAAAAAPQPGRSEAFAVPRWRRRRSAADNMTRPVSPAATPDVKLRTGQYRAAPRRDGGPRGLFPRRPHPGPANGRGYRAPGRLSSATWRVGGAHPAADLRRSRPTIDPGSGSGLPVAREEAHPARCGHHYPPAVVAVPPPTDKQIQQLIEQVAVRLIQQLEKRDVRADTATDTLTEEQPVLSGLTAASAQSAQALGPDACSPIRPPANAPRRCALNRSRLRPARRHHRGRRPWPCRYAGPP